MKLFVTEIQALDPFTGEMKLWAGPYVPGINEETAQEYCQQNKLGYCRVIGELVAENDLEGNIINDYETEQLN